MIIRAHFPSLPVKNTEYRNGSSCFFWEDYGTEGKEKNCVVIDGGEDRLLANTLEDIRKQGITHVTAVCTHGHPDHTRGPEGLLKTSGIFVDRLITPPAEELKALGYDDYKRLSDLISLAKSMGKPVIYPEAGKWTEYKVGGIRMLIWRRKGTTSDPKDYRVNNTSMQVYFPDLLTLITGDTIIIDKVIKILPGKVVLFDGPHHCNACPTAPSKALKAQGAKICVSDDMEPGGTIGETGFTSTGAKRIKEAGITVLCITSPIDVVYADGKMRITQAGKSWEFPIPYKGTAKEGWIHGSKGWWYQNADGTYPTGWAVLPWSQGKNWFYFDSNGWMKTGWVKDKGWWYYLDPATGAMLTGWLQYRGKWCYLEPVAGKNQGHAYTSQTATIDGKTYIFDRDCYATEIKAGSVSDMLTGAINTVTASRRQFVQNIAQLVRQYAPQYGVKVYSPIIAQAILESGWGESSLAAKYHNYFGMKCGTLWKGKSVSMKTGEEYTPGTHTTISANFRVYDSMEEGVKGYFVFLFDGRTRYDNLKGVTDPRDYLQRIKDDGYATSSKYVDNCMSLVTTYALTQFDGPAEAAPAGKYPRADIVSLAQSFVGTQEGGTIHHRIIDKYNEHRPLPRGYKVTYADAWCATFCSYLAIVCGYTDIIPVECGCPQWITLAKGLGAWTESDTYTPNPGDFVLYDWQDSGAGDNAGTPDHIGIVEKVDGQTVTVIEGNYQNSVKRRTIQVGGKYIRGYVAPKYS